MAAMGASKLLIKNTTWVLVLATHCEPRAASCPPSLRHADVHQAERLSTPGLEKVACNASTDADSASDMDTLSSCSGREQMDCAGDLTASDAFTGNASSKRFRAALCGRGLVLETVKLQPMYPTNVDDASDVDTLSPRPCFGREGQMDSCADHSTESDNAITGEFPSKGSVLHSTGQCRPCAWFWRPSSCSKGSDCDYCHLCIAGVLENAVKTRRREARRERRLAMKEMGQSGRRSANHM